MLWQTQPPPQAGTAESKQRLPNREVAVTGLLYMVTAACCLLPVAAESRCRVRVLRPASPGCGLAGSDQRVWVSGHVLVSLLGKIISSSDMYDQVR